MLSNLQDLIHDQSEKVRVAFLDVLLLVKGLKAIKVGMQCPSAVVNSYCYTSQLKYVFRLEENVSRVVGQNSLTP